MKRRPSRGAIAAGLAVAVGLALLLLLRPDPAAIERPPARVGDAAAPAGTKIPPPRPERAAPSASHAPPPRIPEVAGVMRDAALRYRDRARFPPWSHPLADGVDPIRRDREVTPGHSLPQDREPTLRVAAERTSFEHPRPVRIHASLHGAGTALAVASLRGEVRDPAGRVVADLRFQDDGRRGDSTAGDRIHTAEIDVAANHPDWKGAYLVEVWATAATGEARSATSGFLYSVPKGRLTGRFRDAIVQGSVVVEAEIDVWEPARFHVEATLTADGEPLVWSQNAAYLAPGSRWLPITFYGLAFHDAGRDGPYVVQSIALTTAGEMPNQKSEPLYGAHRTGPYRLSELTPEPFADPGLLRAAEALEGR